MLIKNKHDMMLIFNTCRRKLLILSFQFAAWNCSILMVCFFVLILQTPHFSSFMHSCIKILYILFYLIHWYILNRV